MQTYIYKCQDCGKIFELTGEEERNPCPICTSVNTRCKRIIYGKRDHTVRSGNYRHVSDSLAISPEQIPEHRAAFPDVEILPDGRPVFNSVSQQSRYLDKTGFYKREQKIRSKI